MSRGEVQDPNLAFDSFALKYVLCCVLYYINPYFDKKMLADFLTSSTRLQWN